MRGLTRDRHSCVASARNPMDHLVEGGPAGPSFECDTWVCGQPGPDVRYVDNSRVLGSITAVPEPATWAMSILGLGLVGAAARQRRSARPVAA